MIGTANKSEVGHHQTRANKGKDLKYERYDAGFLQVRTQSPSRGRDGARKSERLVPELDCLCNP